MPKHQQDVAGHAASAARTRSGTFVIFAVIVLLGASATAMASGGGLWALALATPAAAVIAVSRWIAWSPGDDSADAESPRWDVAVMITAATVVWLALVDRLSLLYVLAGLCMVTAAGVRRHGWSSAIAVAVIAGAIVGGYAIRVTSADLLLQSAARLRASDSVSAIALYRQAGERNPSNARAFTQLADVLMSQADTTADAAARNAHFTEAHDALARARVADPFEYHHPRNLAALLRRWARVSAPDVRRAHQDEADRYYRAATALAPRHDEPARNVPLNPIKLDQNASRPRITLSVLDPVPNVAVCAPAATPTLSSIS